MLIKLIQEQTEFLRLTELYVVQTQALDESKLEKYVNWDFYKLKLDLLENSVQFQCLKSFGENRIRTAIINPDDVHRVAAAYMLGIESAIGINKQKYKDNEPGIKPISNLDVLSESNYLKHISGYMNGTNKK